MDIIKLEKNENIVEIIRRHPFFFWAETILLVLLGIAPLVIYKIFEVQIAPTVQSYLLAKFIYEIWLLGIWFLIFIAWTDFYFDVWIITNERIIDIDQNGLFSRNVSSLRLEHVQEVTVTTDGLLNTLLHAGNIEAETGADKKQFYLPNVNDPEHARDVIMDAQSAKLDEIKTVHVEKD